MVGLWLDLDVVEKYYIARRFGPCSPCSSWTLTLPLSGMHRCNMETGCFHTWVAYSRFSIVIAEDFHTLQSTCRYSNHSFIIKMCMVHIIIAHTMWRLTMLSSHNFGLQVYKAHHKYRSIIIPPHVYTDTLTLHLYITHVDIMHCVIHVHIFSCHGAYVIPVQMHQWSMRE